MSTFTVLLLCIQACLVQNVFGQACCGSPCGLASGCGTAAYGGTGEGNVAVAGELPVCGNTCVSGQVPIIGAVCYDGCVPASGCVSICGKCACGCGCGAR